MKKSNANNRYCVDPYLIRSSLHVQRSDEFTLIRLKLINDSDKKREVRLFSTTYISQDASTVFIPMIHADNIRVVFSEKDSGRTVIPARSVHHCLLYFSKLPEHITMLQVLELRNEEDVEIGLFLSDIKRNEKSVYDLSVDLKDWRNENTVP